MITVIELDRLISRTVARRSRQREAIIKTLKGTTLHPTAEWIYAQVKQEIPAISLGTVYRNLRLLQQAGEIAELSFTGGVRRFDGHAEPHYHFRCEQCGCVVDLDEPVDMNIDKKVARKTGFEVHCHRLEFTGRCQDCN